MDKKQTYSLLSLLLIVGLLMLRFNPTNIIVQILSYILCFIGGFSFGTSLTIRK